MSLLNARQTRALELHGRGVPLDKIAADFGVTKARVYQIIRKAKRHLDEQAEVDSFRNRNGPFSWRSWLHAHAPAGTRHGTVTMAANILTQMGLADPQQLAGLSRTELTRGSQGWARGAGLGVTTLNLIEACLLADGGQKLNDDPRERGSTNSRRDIAYRVALALSKGFDVTWPNTKQPVTVEELNRAVRLSIELPLDTVLKDTSR